MFKKSPYDIVFSRYVTEKSHVLESLKSSESNKCVRKCEKPKYVFLVDKRSSKKEIAEAVEEIYADKNIKVEKVNVILMKPKFRRVRGRGGYKAGYKKAIVTLTKDGMLEEQV